jgi:DNA-binding NarL/FixJ family response regulator
VSAKQRIRVLLADDHVLFRQGMRLLLEEDRRLEVVAEADDGRQAVELACALRPDVALIDLGMPGGDGLEALERIQRLCPDVRVIIVTMHDDPICQDDAMQAGAAGFLSKGAPLSDLRHAVHDALLGGGSMHVNRAAADEPDHAQQTDPVTGDVASTRRARCRTSRLATFRPGGKENGRKGGRNGRRRKRRGTRNPGGRR